VIKDGVNSMVWLLAERTPVVSWADLNTYHLFQVNDAGCTLRARLTLDPLMLKGQVRQIMAIRKVAGDFSLLLIVLDTRRWYLMDVDTKQIALLPLVPITTNHIVALDSYFFHVGLYFIFRYGVGDHNKPFGHVVPMFGPSFEPKSRPWQYDHRDFIIPVMGHMYVVYFCDLSLCVRGFPLSTGPPLPYDERHARDQNILQLPALSKPFVPPVILQPGFGSSIGCLCYRPQSHVFCILITYADWLTNAVVGGEDLYRDLITLDAIL
jgi:hypothetical protein